MIKTSKWQYLGQVDRNGWIEGNDPVLFDFDSSEKKISPVTFEFLRQNLGFRARLIQNYASSKEPWAEW